MYVTYFNHTLVHASARAFLAAWWRFYGRDAHWVPPYYPSFQRLLRGGTDPYLLRRDPHLLYVEAVSRHQRRPDEELEMHYAGPISAWEHPVAAVAALHSTGGVTHLGLLRCINDARSLNYLLQKVTEETGSMTLLGPTDLSPYLGAGVLESHWNLTPPLHTPYNPPFLPELLQEVMDPALTSHLYHLPVAINVMAPDTPARLSPLQPQQLADDLLPLLVAACEPWHLFAPPDKQEAHFLLRWLGQWPLQGWLAEVAGQPVGFVLLQGDVAPVLQRARGGRSIVRRWWLRRAVRRPAAHGRLLFGGVLADWRRQGIGSQLLEVALQSSAQEGWQALRIGPVPDNSPGAQFLRRCGAEPQQRYGLFRWQASGWF